MVLAELFVVEAKAFEVARGVGLQQEVGLGDQALEQLLPFRMLQVAGDALFARVEHEPEQAAVRSGLIADEGADTPHRVALRRLDLHHVRPHLREGAPGVLADLGGEI